MTLTVYDMFSETSGDDLGLGEMGLGEGGEMPDGGAATLWEDDDMRAFYENFPELKALIPSILYSDSEKPTATPVRAKVACLEITSIFLYPCAISNTVRPIHGQRVLSILFSMTWHCNRFCLSH